MLPQCAFICVLYIERYCQMLLPKNNVFLWRMLVIKGAVFDNDFPKVSGRHAKDLCRLITCLTQAVRVLPNV